MKKLLTLQNNKNRHYVFDFQYSQARLAIALAKQLNGIIQVRNRSDFRSEISLKIKVEVAFEIAGPTRNRETGDSFDSTSWEMLMQTLQNVESSSDSSLNSKKKSKVRKTSFLKGLQSMNDSIASNRSQIKEKLSPLIQQLPKFTMRSQPSQKKNATAN